MSHIDTPQLLDLIYDAVIVRDLETFAIRYWNRGATDLYGWSPEEAIERQLESLLLTVYPEPRERLLATVVEAGRWEGELRQRTRAGEVLTVASRWIVRRDERGTALLQIDRDISQQKKAETSWARIRAAREEEVRRLGELAAMKVDFTAMVVHEFFGPLAAIGRLADALATGALGGEVHDAAIAAIRREVELLMTLTGDVRAVATAERDDFAVHPRPTPLTDILSAAQSYALTLAELQPLRVETPVPTGLLVCADGQRIGQVLRNLLGNGAKYAPPGAPLVLRATLLPDGSRVELAVVDRGYGIHPGDLERILEKFGRGRDVEGRRLPGAGLGLYLSRRILLAHGSDFRVESVQGEGSTFAFSLEVVG